MTPPTFGIKWFPIPVSLLMGFLPLQTIASMWQHFNFFASRRGSVRKPYFSNMKVDVVNILPHNREEVWWYTKTVSLFQQLCRLIYITLKCIYINLALLTRPACHTLFSERGVALPNWVWPHETKFTCAGKYNGLRLSRHWVMPIFILWIVKHMNTGTVLAEAWTSAVCVCVPVLICGNTLNFNKNCC